MLLQIWEPAQLAALLALASELVPAAGPTVLIERLPRGGGDLLPEVHTAPDCLLLVGHSPRAHLAASIPPPRNVAVCSCVLGNPPEPQRLLDNLHELLVLRRALDVDHLPRLTELVPGFGALVQEQVRRSASTTFTHPMLEREFAALVTVRDAAVVRDDVWADLAAFAARAVTYESLLRAVPGRVDAPAVAALEDVLGGWLLDPTTPHDPYGVLERELTGLAVTAREQVLTTVGPLRVLRPGWCGTLKLALADTELVVCEIIGGPGIDLGPRGMVAAQGVRVGVPFQRGRRAFGVYPESVARWLGSAVRHEFAGVHPGPALLRRCGPLTGTPAGDDWDCALVLYADGDGGFGSFADALDAAIRL